MLPSPKLSLSSSPLYMSLFVILSLGIFIGAFWTYNEYEAYQQSVANIRQKYHREYKQRLFEESRKITDFIEYKRSQLDNRIGDEIREKVHSAYSIAAHMHSLYGDEAEIDELRSIVLELLRPLRWDGGLGYYFVGRVSTGVIELFADKPQLEGINFLQSDNKIMADVVRRMIDIIKDRGAGQLVYNWTKPESTAGFYPKVAFVKYFEPFDWFIGTGIYVDEMESRIQQDILDRINRIRFDQDGEVIVTGGDGTIISHNKGSLLGRPIIALRDGQGNSYGEDILKVASSTGQQGYISYMSTMGQGSAQVKKLCFAEYFADWDWVIGVSVSMAEMESAIQEETGIYQSIAFKNTLLFVVLFILAVAVLLMVSYVYSLKIKAGIEHFTEFFRSAADSKTTVEKEKLSFREFEILGEYANRMNADRLTKEKIIKRDEMRLDTLLALGRMESLSLRENFEFILERTVALTESEAGYIVIVENRQPVLQAQFTLEGAGSLEGENSPGKMARYDSTLQKVINQRRTVLRDGINDPAWHSFFPIKGTVQHRLDVPVVENDNVVAVLGLCNKKTGYVEDDKRQVNLLLEGVWLHRAKVISQNEMKRLRFLLKSITDSMPSMLIGVDSELNIVQWNNLAEERLGLTAEEVLGRDIGSVVPHLAKHIIHIKRVITSGERVELTRMAHVIEAELHYETVTIYPLESQDIRGAVLRIDDVTEMVAMEEMVIQSEKMVSVGGLAAGIAHEINNPLASVTQNLQMVKKRLAAKAGPNRRAADELGLDLALVDEYMQQRGLDKMLDIIDRDSARAAKLVHNLLSFSRKSTSNFVYSDLRILLENALEFGLADYDLKKSKILKKIKVTKDFAEALPEVYCDETNIQQVFLNIITNAVHALNGGDTSHASPELRLTVKGGNEEVRVEIADNGCGMNSRTRKKIFEPFFTTKEVGKGTGLGLSISYYIVTDQHSGALSVSSAVGEGTTFCVHLPCGPPSD